jgi:IclR family mhp operon transcriptional activator
MDILALLNKQESCSALEISRELGTPRATVYRILETLGQKGFVYQHESDNQFRLTEKVRSLSSGFTRELHLAVVSKPLMKALTQRVAWPVSLTTISDGELVVLEHTDRFSTLAVEKFYVGHRMPILNTASGLCLLAFMDDTKRAGVLAMLKVEQEIPEEALREKLNRIRRRGYSLQQRAKDRVKITAVSVPISKGEGLVFGALTLRFTEPAVSRELLKSLIVPAMQNTAEEISREAGQLI